MGNLKGVFIDFWGKVYNKLQELGKGAAYALNN